MGLHLYSLLSLLSLLSAGTVHCGEVFRGKSIVAQWPRSNAFRVGEAGRINFTLVEGARFTTLGLKALFVGDTGLKPIYTAVPNVEKIDEKQTQHFEVIRQKKHDIKIKSMKWTLAGYYTASATDDAADTEAGTCMLAAIEPMTCRLRNAKEVVDEGDIVNLDCSTRYTGPRAMEPTMHWKREDGSELPSYIVNNPPVDGDRPTTTLAPSVPKQVTYRTNLTANKDHNAANFRCVLTFDNVKDGPVPYTDECAITIKVKYPTTTIKFSPDPTPGTGRFKTGDLLNCSASGNPEPTYTWSGKTANGEMFVDDSILKMTEEMVGGLNKFTCRASNKIDGQDNEVKRNITFYVTRNSDSGSQQLTASIGLIYIASLMAKHFF